MIPKTPTTKPKALIKFKRSLKKIIAIGATQSGVE